MDFIHHPEKLVEVLEEEKRHLIAFLNYLLKMNLQSIKINPAIKGKTIYSTFYVIELMAKEDRKQIEIGLTFVDKQTAQKSSFLYWIYFYQKEVSKLKKKINIPMIANKLVVKAEKIEGAHDAINIKVETTNLYLATKQLELHFVDLEKYILIHNDESINYWKKYRNNYKNQLLLLGIKRERNIKSPKKKYLFC